MIAALSRICPEHSCYEFEHCHVIDGNSSSRDGGLLATIGQHPDPMTDSSSTK